MSQTTSHDHESTGRGTPASSLESLSKVESPVDDIQTASPPNSKASAESHGRHHSIAIDVGQSLGYRQKLTLEDCVDMDVDVLTTVLERSFQSLKRDTLDFFVDARTRLKTRALSELGQERRIAERAQQTKNEEISLLEQDLKKEGQRVERLLESLTRMAEAIGAANQRKRAYRLLMTLFQSWVQFTKTEKRLKHKMRRALRYYCQEYLERRALVQWVEFVREQNRTCARERFQTKLAIASSAIETQFNEKFEALKEENAKLKEKLKIEGEARSKLEEDMQQAFMRGVCALNMEALSVMKRGMPPNGINPFFANGNGSERMTLKELMQPTNEPRQ